MNISPPLSPLTLIFFLTHNTEKISYENKSKNMSLNPNAQKSYKNYLQNMAHMVLRNRPTLSLATESLTCLNNSCGVQLGTLT